MRIATAILFLSSFGGAALAQSSPLTLSTFVDQISRDTPDQLPGALEISKVFDTISELSASDLSRVLPRFAALLSSQEVDKKKIAIVALMGVARRSDGADLISPLTDTLLRSMDDSDAFVSSQAILLLANLYPAPQPTLVNLFVLRLGREPADSPKGPMIAYGLIKMAPDSPAAQDAIVTLLRRTAGKPEIGIKALLAVASPRVTSEKLIAAILELTSGSANPRVKVAAITTLQRIGPKAIAQASPQLSALANNKAETDAVRTAAQDALHLQSAQ